MATGTTVVPSDDTIPQSTEGDQFMTQAITPTSLVNLLRVSHLGHYSNSSSADIAAALFQDSAVNALSVGWNTVPNTGYAHTPSLEYLMIAGTSSVTTFKIRAGAGAGTTTFNGAGGARKYGGVLSSRLTVEEIFV